MVEIDHYKVLDLPSGAKGVNLAMEEITKRYLEKMRLLSPKQRPDYPHAAEELQQITKSYVVLMDPKSRFEFNVRLLLNEITFSDAMVWGTGLICLAVGLVATQTAVTVVKGSCSLVKNVCVGTANSIGSACDSVTKAIGYKEEPKNNPAADDEWEIIAQTGAAASKSRLPVL